MQTVIDLLPPNLAEWLRYWAPLIVAVLAATTALVRAMLPIAKGIETWAIHTPATWDDGPARTLAGIVETTARVLGKIVSWLPHVTVGPGKKGQTNA